MATNNAVNNGLTGATGTVNFVGSTSPTIVTPKIAQINDVNGNTILGLTPVAMAVNYIQIQNQITGTAFSGPSLNAAGTDTNIAVGMLSKGTGIVLLGAATAAPIEIISGTGFQHATTFSFADTAQARTVTFPDASGTLLMTGQAISTVPSIAFSSTSGIIGTTTNNDAAAGSVGELIESQILAGTPVSLTTGSFTDVTSINLTAGDWDVWGNVFFVVGTSTTNIAVGISDTSQTLPDSSLVSQVAATTLGIGLTAVQQRVSIGTATTIYLVSFATFTGTCGACGLLAARRVR